MSKPPSKAAQVRQAERTLLGLLRTPKTRTGLIAAVKSKVISEHFVYGFLAEGRNSGELVTFKSGRQLMYQVAAPTVAEVPEASVYPSWLDPRALPIATSRLVVIDGEVIKTDGKEEQK